MEGRAAGGGTTTTLLLWRHGRTEWNAAGRFQGQHDVPLDEVGLDQAEHAAEALTRWRPQVLYSSPLERARQTAGALARRTGLEPRLDDRLAEINVGSWVGLTPADLAGDPEYAKAARGVDFRRSPSGETATEVGERVAGGVRELASSNPGKRVVVASHGLAIRMGVGALLGWDFETTWWLGAVRNCHWVELSVSEPAASTGRRRWRLQAYNVGG
ncbi:histidine phosphatase family protein [Aestuariimicrobium soli]|uniref:histidine phosphatase family protein n=1 Tax=Aestuariimicrobium soli TaxID=2035834 RepID=UPI003EBFFBB7